MALEHLPEELILSIGDHLPANTLRPCSRSLRSLFQLHVDSKWSLYDPNRVRSLWRSFLPLHSDRAYDLLLMPFEAYCQKHGHELEDGTPSFETLQATDHVESQLGGSFSPLDSPHLHCDDVDELWYIQRRLIPPNSRYNYPACWRCGLLVCEHL